MFIGRVGVLCKPSDADVIVLVHESDSIFEEELKEGAIVFDPWRTYESKTKRHNVFHYGNTRT